MGAALGQLGMQVAGGLIGGGMGALFAKGQDRRQLKQQQKLTDMQMNADKHMSSYNKDLQLQMWKDTSYNAQKGEIEKAGLNPALMYGMGGGGGQTANVSTGNVGGGRAEGNSGEAMAGAGMGMMGAAQLRLIEAQKENIEADTANKKADIPVKGAQVPSIEQGTKTAAQEEKKKWEETREINMRNLIEQVAQNVDMNGKDAEGNIQNSAAVKERLGRVLMHNMDMEMTKGGRRRNMKKKEEKCSAGVFKRIWI